MKLSILESLAHLGDGAQRVLGIGEIDLDVIFGSGGPGTVFRKGVTRAGDHAPARAREALDRRMTDAAARAGEDQRAPLFVCVLRPWISHGRTLARAGEDCD